MNYQRFVWKSTKFSTNNRHNQFHTLEYCKIHYKVSKLSHTKWILTERHFLCSWTYQKDTQRTNQKWRVHTAIVRCSFIVYERVVTEDCQYYLRPRLQSKAFQIYFIEESSKEADPGYLSENRFYIKQHYIWTKRWCKHGSIVRAGLIKYYYDGVGKGNSS